MMLALVALLATGVARPFGDERQLLDRRLETLRRILPDGANALADAAFVKGIGEGAKLWHVESLARPPVETSSRGDVIVDVAALGRFTDIDRFFRQVALSHRLIDVESLTMTATPDDTVRLTAVLRLPYRPSKAPLPPPPDGTRARTNGASKFAAEAFIRDQALAVAKSEAIAALRRARRNPRLFLAELAAVARGRPVLLKDASLGDEFVVRGLTVGEGSARALESRLERGYFRVSEFLMARRGACHQFEVRGKAPVVGIEAELPMPAEDPFEQDDTPCRVDRDSGHSFVVKGPNTKTPGKGPLTLRLRDIDLADTFFVLHLLTSQGFIVDEDVRGRITVELMRVTLDEALAAIAKAAGLNVSGAGPIRRVSLGKAWSPRPLPAPGGGSPASFKLKRAEVRDILAVMSEADPALAALGPQGFLGRVSLWARDASLADVRAAVLDAAGLTERVEEERRILGKTGGSDEVVVPVARTAPDPRLVLQAQDVALLEFDLAGLVSAGDTWLAVAYSPTGALNAYRAGDRLADASVKAVESTDVLLETDEGPLHLPVAPLK